MAFDLTIWKEKAQQRLQDWKPRMRRAGVDSVYAFVSAAALWPVVEAAQAGEWAALAALGGVLSGLGSNLLANQIQNWKDEKDAAQELAQSVPENSQLRAELDEVLEQLGALAMAGQALSEEDRQWFAETLQAELEKIDSGLSYDATLIGDGAIAQGEGAIAVGAGGKYTHVEQIFPDPREIAAEKQTEARERYLQRLYRDCQTLPLVDLGSEPGSGERVTLKDVYIDLNTTHKVPLPEDEQQDRPKGIVGLGKDERSYTAFEAAADHTRLALLGGPGSGKSTFGRYLVAWQAAAELGEIEHPPDVSKGLLPIFLVLRDLILRLSGLDLDGLPTKERDAALVTVMEEQIGAELARLHGEEIAQSLNTILCNGKCLLILDGLDEVPQALRAGVRQAVCALRKTYPLERILLTCRVRSYEGEAVQPDFAQYTLAPFSQDQVRAFARGWYQAQADQGEVDQDQVEAKGDDLAEAAWEPDLRELAMNPMMLTTMAIIHQKEYTLPSQRVRLYHLAVEVLLQRWQKRKTGEALTGNPALNDLLKDDLRLRRIMERLAYAAHQSGESDGAADLPRMQALEILEEEMYIGDLEVSKDFLDYVDQRAGLLVGRGGKPGRPTDYSFPHRTFQEYLAGCYLTGHRQAARKIIDHATEPEYWSLAVEMGAEEIYYNGGTIGVNSVLDLIYRLFPRGEIDTDIKARRTLWTGKMAVLVGSETLRQDDLQDGRVVLEKLRENLVDIIGERVGVDADSSITAPERADAGCVLGKLGDPRVEVLAVDAMPLCYIPAGAFLMGSTEDDESARDDEQPQHEVDLPVYWISRYPITNGQYDQFVQEGGYGQESYWSEAQVAGVWKNGKVQGRWDDDARIAPVDYGEPLNLSNHPVVGVTWYEALAFTRWLTDYWRDQKFLPKDWRVVLPSEAEWEKAARGGLEIPKQSIVRIIQDGLSLSPEKALKPNPLPARIYPWGDDFDANKANASATGVEATSTPGCFSGWVSPYGLFDLSGNVWEWTCSLWGKDWQKPDYEYPYDPSDGRENLEAGDSLLRVLRGGAFDVSTRDVRCAVRFDYSPGFRSWGFGFRVCVSPLPRRGHP